MKVFGEIAMGAPFIFAPDEYRKGSGPREPADLVWACNGCVVLIYLTRKKDAARAQQHNMQQVHGWLRAWRTLGQTLDGHNRYGPFSIDSADARYPHVVVLSVIECDDAIAEYHHAETRALGVTMFATVPLGAIAYLARMHASMLDVLHILDWLRVRHATAIPEADLLAGIAGYHAAAWRVSGADTAWAPDAHDPYLVIDHLLYSMRALAPESFEQPSTVQGQGARGGPHGETLSGMLPMASVFGDLTLHESLWVAVQIKETIDAFQARARQPDRPPQTGQVLLQHVPLTHYDITLCAVAATGPGPAPDIVFERLDDFARQHDRTGAGRFGPAIKLFVRERPPSLVNAIPVVPPQPSPSATEIFLDRCRAEQSTGSGRA